MIGERKHNNFPTASACTPSNVLNVSEGYELQKPLNIEDFNSFEDPALNRPNTVMGSRSIHSNSKLYYKMQYLNNEKLGEYQKQQDFIHNNRRLFSSPESMC